MEHELFTLLCSILLSLWTATGKGRPSMDYVTVGSGCWDCGSPWDRSHDKAWLLPSEEAEEIDAVRR